ncbi:MAG: hypothetical protein GW949_08160 [Spirochaetales bacterium]|nr:hypothetical protein [Spirochaetales bacterium]
MDKLTPPIDGTSKFCSHCGIEVLDPPLRCPLCNGVLDSSPQIAPHQLYPRQSIAPPISPVLSSPSGSRRFAASWIVILTLLIPAVVSLLTDWLGDRNITWSRIVALSLGAVGGLAVGSILLWPRVWLVNLSLWIWISLYLFFLNSIFGGSSWALGIGIPITFLSGGLGTLTVYTLKALKPGPFRSIGTSLFFLSLGLGGIELLIYLNLGIRNDILWSIITAGILIPLGVIFFVIHHIVQRSPGAHKFFHW